MAQHRTAQNSTHLCEERSYVGQVVARLHVEPRSLQGHAQWCWLGNSEGTPAGVHSSAGLAVQTLPNTEFAQRCATPCQWSNVLVSNEQCATTFRCVTPLPACCQHLDATLANVPFWGCFFTSIFARKWPSARMYMVSWPCFTLMRWCLGHMRFMACRCTGHAW